MGRGTGLDSAIGMVNEACPRPPKIEDGVERGQAKTRVQEMADGVTDDSPRPHVEHDPEKNEAGSEPDGK